MVLDFISTLGNINLDKLIIKEDGALVSYIQKSIFHSYCKRQTANSLYREIPFSNLSDKELYTVDNTPYASDETLENDFTAINEALNETEREIIKLIFFLGYKVSEVAEMHRISRQAVNQAKNRALNKLRQDKE